MPGPKKKKFGGGGGSYGADLLEGIAEVLGGILGVSALNLSPEIRAWAASAPLIDVLSKYAPIIAAAFGLNDIPTAMFEGALREAADELGKEKERQASDSSYAARPAASILKTKLDALKAKFGTKVKTGPTGIAAFARLPEDIRLRLEFTIQALGEEERTYFLSAMAMPGVIDAESLFGLASIEEEPLRKDTLVALATKVKPQATAKKFDIREMLADLGMKIIAGEAKERGEFLRDVQGIAAAARRRRAYRRGEWPILPEQTLATGPLGGKARRFFGAVWSWIRGY